MNARFSSADYMIYLADYFKICGEHCTQGQLIKYLAFKHNHQ